LRSEGKFTPVAGYDMPVRVQYTLVSGQVAYHG
jgi:dihydroorotase-like cyclic amidohydrolase